MIIERLFKKIKDELPHLENAVTFYNDGTVYFSSFPRGENEVNTPHLGIKLAEVIKSLHSIQLICEAVPKTEEQYKYKRIMYETQQYLIIIIDLGQDSNIALFFKHVKGEDVNISCIKEELDILEDLIDTTEEELKDLGYES